jgi:hypothetical protein
MILLWGSAVCVRPKPTGIRGVDGDLRALVARARGKPYLASRFDKSIIRDV